MFKGFGFWGFGFGGLGFGSLGLKVEAIPAAVQLQGLASVVTWCLLMQLGTFRKWGNPT